MLQGPNCSLGGCTEDARRLEAWKGASEVQVPGEERFNRMLIKLVEETISEVLGANVAEAFGYHFYAYLGLSREDIPSHLKELSSALNGSFGVGGRVLERAIWRKLCAELGLSLVHNPDCSLANCVEDAKKMFLKGLKDKGTE